MSAFEKWALEHKDEVCAFLSEKSNRWDPNDKLQTQFQLENIFSRLEDSFKRGEPLEVVIPAGWTKSGESETLVLSA